MKQTREFAQQLIDFCYASPTAFHAVASTREILEQSKFVQLHENESWKIKSGGRYYLMRHDSALIAFVVGSAPISEQGFKIVGAHTDSPGFRIKPAPEMLTEGAYVKLNTEVYGGPILSTWFDRPLAVAGRVALKSKNPMQPQIRLLNIRRPVCIIPNIAIHMNPDANNGFTPNKQVDTLPLLSTINQKLEEKNYLSKLIASELRIKETDILDFDLFLYEYEKGCLIGSNEEFISSSRIDDLSSVHAGISALCKVTRPKATCVMACFDHEEVGSSTMQGADSQLLAEVLDRIVIGMKGGREEYFRALANSYIISADGAHAVHPNKGEKADPTSRPLVNRGLVIKLSANRSYTTDAATAATFIQLCEKAGVKTQRFVNRSDMRGGSTIGPISSTHVSIRSVDIGLPMLAMHSIRELCGIEDHSAMLKVIQELYQG